MLSGVTVGAAAGPLRAPHRPRTRDSRRHVRGAGAVRAGLRIGASRSSISIDAEPMRIGKDADVREEYVDAGVFPHGGHAICCAGVHFADDERRGRPKVCVVNESMARQFFGARRSDRPPHRLRQSDRHRGRRASCAMRASTGRRATCPGWCSIRSRRARANSRAVCTCASPVRSRREGLAALEHSVGESEPRGPRGDDAGCDERADGQHGSARSRG